MILPVLNNSVRKIGQAGGLGLVSIICGLCSRNLNAIRQYFGGSKTDDQNQSSAKLSDTKKDNDIKVVSNISKTKHWLISETEKHETYISQIDNKTDLKGFIRLIESENKRITNIQQICVNNFVSPAMYYIYHNAIRLRYVYVKDIARTHLKKCMEIKDKKKAGEKFMEYDLHVKVALPMSVYALEAIGKLVQIICIFQAVYLLIMFITRLVVVAKNHDQAVVFFNQADSPILFGLRYGAGTAVFLVLLPYIYVQLLPFCITESIVSTLFGVSQPIYKCYNVFQTKCINALINQIFNRPLYKEDIDFEIIGLYNTFINMLVQLRDKSINSTFNFIKHGSDKIYVQIENWCGRNSTILGFLRFMKPEESHILSALKWSSIFSSIASLKLLLKILENGESIFQIHIIYVLSFIFFGLSRALENKRNADIKIEDSAFWYYATTIKNVIRHPIDTFKNQFSPTVIYYVVEGLLFRIFSPPMILMLSALSSLGLVFLPFKPIITMIVTIMTGGLAMPAKILSLVLAAKTEKKS